MIAPVVAIGAVPFFFPIDATGAPRFEALEGVNWSGVRAMIAVHYFGLPQPMAAIRRMCDERGIALIEDCAHAIFGESDGRPIGNWGDYSIASLTKFFPVTDGGCLASASRAIENGVAQQHTFSDEFKSFANVIELGAKYGKLPGVNRLLTALFFLADALRGNGGFNSNPLSDITNSQTGGTKFRLDAALGDSALRQASKWARWTVRTAARERIVALRRKNYEQLAELLAGMPGTRVLQPRLPECAAPYVFPLWVDAPETTYQQVRKSGVPVFRWDEIWPTTPHVPGDRGLEWATHVFQLGCHQDLGSGDLGRIAHALKVIFG
jgi:hypothetical protein